MVNAIENFRKYIFGNEAVCSKVLGTFSMLANKTRFRIICLLTEGDFCVQEITEAIDAGEMSFVSQQLKSFMLAGLVTKKKSGRKVYYSLADPKLRELIAMLRELYLNQPTGGIEE